MKKATDSGGKPYPGTNRRRFLAGSLAGGLAAAGGAGEALARRRRNPLEPDPADQPPNVPDWSKTLGDGVADHPYGMPSKFESKVVRRDVEWLTASRQSSVNFSPIH
ncbi:MAG: sulfite dehydrogenase, partial [Hyphomicrobiaceae bacterium]